MNNATQQNVNKAWNFAHVLRNDGLSYMAGAVQRYRGLEQPAGAFVILTDLCRELLGRVGQELDALDDPQIPHLRRGEYFRNRDIQPGGNAVALA